MFFRTIKKIKKKCFCYFERKKFAKCGQHFSVDTDFETRCPRYIYLGESFNAGTGCKILCWDEYLCCRIPQILSPKVCIGENFRATRNVVIQCAGHMTFGKNVLVASNVFITDFNHGISELPNVAFFEQPLIVKDVHIGSNVWIGQNVVILPGVSIGDNCVIGAGAIVSKSIPKNSIAVGNPAKVVKKIKV